MRACAECRSKEGLPERGAARRSWNRGKKGVALDLNTPISRRRISRGISKLLALGIAKTNR